MVANMQSRSGRELREGFLHGGKDCYSFPQRMRKKEVLKGRKRRNRLYINEHLEQKLLRFSHEEKVRTEGSGNSSMSTWDCVVGRILELCEQRGWSINHLAMEAGIAPTTIKNILDGRSRNPGVVTIRKMCDGWGITLVEFFDTEAFRTLEQEIQ